MATIEKHEGPFLLFAGDNYYPNGGANDCIGIFQSEEEALLFLKKSDEHDWFHVAVIKIRGLKIIRRIVFNASLFETEDDVFIDTILNGNNEKDPRWETSPEADRS